MNLGKANYSSRGMGRLSAFLAVTVAIALLILVVVQANTRKPWNDEAMAALAGYNLGHHGHTGVSFYDEQGSGYPGITKHSYYIFPMQLYVLAPWFRVMPFTLLSFRMLSILWSAAALVGIWFAVRALTGGDRTLAWLTVALTAFDYQIMTAASFGRYDTMVAALGFGAYGVWLVMRLRNLPLALFLANAMVTLAGLTHPNGVIYFLGLWFLILYQERKRLNFRLLVLSVVPYVLGGVFFVSHVMEDLPSFRGQMNRNSGGRIGLLNPLKTLQREAELRYIRVFGLGAHSAGHESPVVKLKAVTLVLWFGSVLFCLLSPSIRRNPIYRALLVLFGIHLFMLTFYENMKFAYYLVHLIPLYCAVVALAVVTIWRRGSALRVPVAAFAAAVCLLHVGGVIMKIRIDDFHKEYLPAVQYVKEHMPANPEPTVVFASCGFGFNFGFEHLTDDDFFGYFSHKRPLFLVMDEIYDGQHEIYKTEWPDRYAYIRKTLSTYDLVFQAGDYRVYQRHESVQSR